MRGWTVQIPVGSMLENGYEIETFAIEKICRIYGTVLYKGTICTRE